MGDSFNRIPKVNVTSLVNGGRTQSGCDACCVADTYVIAFVRAGCHHGPPFSFKSAVTVELSADNQQMLSTSTFPQYHRTSFASQES